MIANDNELQVSRERIAKFQGWFAQMREKASPKDFETMASGYRLEIERMQAEVMDYLLRPVAAEDHKQPA